MRSPKASLTPADIVSAQEQLGAILEAIRRDELTAPPGLILRLEGAYAALITVTEGLSQPKA